MLGDEKERGPVLTEIQRSLCYGVVPCSPCLEVTVRNKKSKPSKELSEIQSLHVHI